MSIESGSVLIIDINGVVMAVTPGSAIPASTSAFLMAGTDGTNARTLSVDTSGRPVFVGAGVAGTPAGGVVSIQGVSGGTAIPVSGSITATNASIGTTGSAPPASATYIGGNDGTNLVGLKLKPASTAAVATDPSLVVTFSPNTGLPTGANVIGAVTQSGTWSVTATQTTAANLNALVAQGAAGTAANGWFVKLTDGTNTAPTFDVAARAGFQKITDGTNTAAVKAASTAPVATDPSLVVVLSPNQQAIPVTVATATDRTSTGAITTTQNVAVSTQGSGSAGIQITGTWTGTVVFESSVDAGTTWNPLVAQVPTTGAEVTSATANGVWTASVAGFQQIRVRGNTVATGSATIFLNSSAGTQVVVLGDPLPTGSNTIGAVTQGTGSGSAATYWYTRVTDGTNTMPTMDAVARKGFQAITDGTNGPAAVKAASTAAVATDPSLVVALSPNSPIPTGANVIGAVTQSGGPWTVSGTVTANQGTANTIANSWRVQVTDLTNTMPTMDVAARKGFMALTDGTNTVAVKAASTAAVATDPALVVAISPNNTIAATQSGTWSVTATQAVAANLNATVVQGTAANLNATVVGAGTAGTPNAGVVTVQGIASMTALITTEKRSSTSAITSVAAATSSTSLLAANANRIAALITNDGNSVLYVALSTSASTTAYTYRLTANSQVVIDGQWTGAIFGIWNVANGNARITELT